MGYSVRLNSRGGAKQRGYSYIKSLPANYLHLKRGDTCFF